MPEGDTVHKVAAYLDAALRGKRLDGVRIRPGPRSGWGGTAPEALRGRRVAGVRALGKHLFVDLEGGLALRTHLGLHGAWHRYRRGEPWRKPEDRAALVLEAGDDTFVCFHAREVAVVRAGGFGDRDLRAHLGPDLAADAPDLAAAVARAREHCDPGAPVADVLLDQRAAAGIGNVYKSEVCFLEGVSPDAPVGVLPDAALQRLFARAHELLRRNLGGGPRTTRFEADGRGRLWVYGRAGEPCLRCGAPIRLARTGRDLRSTYWCARCQPAP